MAERQPVFPPGGREIPRAATWAGGAPIPCRPWRRGARWRSGWTWWTACCSPAAHPISSRTTTAKPAVKAISTTRARRHHPAAGARRAGRRRAAAGHLSRPARNQRRFGGSLHGQVHALPACATTANKGDTLDAQYGLAHPLTLAEGGVLHQALGATHAEVNSPAWPGHPHPGRRPARRSLGAGWADRGPLAWPRPRVLLWRCNGIRNGASTRIRCRAHCSPPLATPVASVAPPAWRRKPRALTPPGSGRRSAHTMRRNTAVAFCEGF